MPTYLNISGHRRGDEFSAANCAAFPFLKYGLFRDPADDELFLSQPRRLPTARRWPPRLGDWIRRVNERPRA